MMEGKHTPEQLREIQTEQEFSERINDMKNQIMPFILCLQYGLSIERLREDKTKCINFEENLKHYNEKLSPEIMSNVDNMEQINFYNGLIARLKVFETKEELEHIIKEYKEGAPK